MDSDQINKSSIIAKCLFKLEPLIFFQNESLIYFEFQASFHDITVPNVYYKIERSGDIVYSKRYTVTSE